LGADPDQTVQDRLGADLSSGYAGPIPANISANIAGRSEHFQLYQNSKYKKSTKIFASYRQGQKRGGELTPKAERLLHEAT
jgi:hypothetical protein